MDRVRNQFDSSLELQVVLRAFPDLYFQLDSGGVFVDYHAATRSEPDLPPEFFIGKSFRDVLPEPVARNLDFALKRVDEIRSTVVFEYLMKHHGKTHSFEARVVHVFEDEYLVVARDITERKEVEEKLRDSEQQYRFLFENNPSPMWIYDLESLQFLAVNQAAIRQYGYSVEEFLRMDTTEIRPPDSIFLEAVKRLGSHLGLVFSRKREQEKIRYQATHDLLTGLPNRILFQDRHSACAQANAAVARMRRVPGFFDYQASSVDHITPMLAEGIKLPFNCGYCRHRRLGRRR